MARPGSVVEEMRMRSWRSRIAAAAVVGAAAVAIPLTARTASAAYTDPDGFHLAGGTLTHDQCRPEGRLDLEMNRCLSEEPHDRSRRAPFPRDGSAGSRRGSASPPDTHPAPVTRVPPHDPIPT